MQKRCPLDTKILKKRESDRHRFGDLIIWFQIIEYAKKEARDIIFVTEDKKEDWWEEYKDNKIGPRHELIREFHSMTNNQLIWFYTPDRFLQNAKSKVGVQVKLKTIEEIKRPYIDLTTVFGYDTFPRKGALLNSRWPLTSLNESNPLDTEISSIQASYPYTANFFPSQSIGSIGYGDIPYLNNHKINDFLSLGDSKIDHLFSRLADGDMNKETKSESDQNDKNNQAKDGE